MTFQEWLAVGLLLGGMAALAVVLNKILSFLMSEASPVEVPEASPVEELPELEEAILQHGHGLVGYRLLVELRKHGVFTNRETLRRALNDLRYRNLH